MFCTTYYLQSQITYLLTYLNFKQFLSLFKNMRAGLLNANKILNSISRPRSEKNKKMFQFHCRWSKMKINPRGFLTYTGFSVVINRVVRGFPAGNSVGALALSASWFQTWKLRLLFRKVMGPCPWFAATLGTMGFSITYVSHNK